MSNMFKIGTSKKVQRLYRLFLRKKLSLNDHLAAIRSMLANERTFLAYQRVALAQLITGFGLIKFFDEVWIDVIGFIFIPTAIFTFMLGLVRYRRMRTLVLRLETVTIRKNEHPEEFDYLDKRLHEEQLMDEKQDNTEAK